MFLAPEHRTEQRADGWYWRCCYGCHGCSRELFGPFPSHVEALLARYEMRFKHSLNTHEPETQPRKEMSMAKVGEMIESKYLKQSDIDHDALVTIEKVGKANIAREGDEPEYKWLVRFAEVKKPMVLNSTNIKRLAKACNSDDTDDWVGKQVVLYVDPDVEYAGNVVGGLRIRAHKQPTQTRSVMPQQTGGKFDDMSDDVPF
jgi:hypothetical protein